MNRLLILCAFLLLSFSALSQKNIDIPDNDQDKRIYKHLSEGLQDYGLADLTNSTDDLVIRIWNDTRIIEVKQGELTEASCIFKIGTLDNQTTKHVTFDSEISQQLLNALLNQHVMTIPDGKRSGIDGRIIIVEVATPNKYRMYSYWSPTADRNENEASVVKIVRLCNEVLDLSAHWTAFIESLEPGGYQIGMRSIRIDQFLPSEIEKSELYLSVEDRLKNQLNITEQTSHQHFPLIILNGRLVYLKDLNTQKAAKVKELNVVEGASATALYGTQAKYGVVLVKTKE